MNSPCIKICQIDRNSGLCTGCWRSLDEIAGWSSYSEETRSQIMSGLDSRRVAHETRGGGISGAR
ncbi:DUF1289 domain-containing protein [Roseibium porphyridii]|uniref:DUF1289 domain-containing protein n=1 Tax=Roseibium porphyridii TaxID=2866279 RepID=A0ABY8F5A3_9HYPH|nr:MULTISPECIES: DUF1289 domain-containing protein [Stappiaceae]WFE87903.1 DUF1289 domain-containing protein [Roseibium sp. KMA01]